MSRQLAFVIDLKRCIGCDTCVIACKVEHNVAPGRFRLKVLDSNGEPISEKPQGLYPDLVQHWEPSMCRHCVDAPCITACAPGALWRREEDGIVMLDAEQCTGCLLCGDECPYDALSFDPQTGVADKCDMCAHRLADGLRPSCELTCPTRAIHVGDLDNLASEISTLLAIHGRRLRDDQGDAKPQVYYLEPR